MSDDIQGDESLQKALSELALNEGDSVVVNEEGMRVLQLTPELMESLMQSLRPQPHPIIIDTLNKFKAFDTLNDPEFGVLAVEIVGTDDWGVPLAIFEIREHFGQVTASTLEKELMEEGEVEEDWNMASHMVAFAAGIEFARKNGAAPIADEVAV